MSRHFYFVFYILSLLLPSSLQGKALRLKLPTTISLESSKKIELIEQLGAGGIGGVYVGHVIEPVQSTPRRVTVKIFHRSVEPVDSAEYKIYLTALTNYTRFYNALADSPNNSADPSPFLSYNIARGEVRLDHDRTLDSYVIISNEMWGSVHDAKDYFHISEADLVQPKVLEKKIVALEAQWNAIERSIVAMVSTGRGFAHQDIKPGNFLLTGPPEGLFTGETKILLSDFDLISESSKVISGSPAFDAPEKLRWPGGFATPLSDLWSGAATMIYLVLKETPNKMIESMTTPLAGQLYTRRERYHDMFERLQQQLFRMMIKISDKSLKNRFDHLAQKMIGSLHYVDAKRLENLSIGFPNSLLAKNAQRILAFDQAHGKNSSCKPLTDQVAYSYWSTLRSGLGLPKTIQPVHAY